MSKLNRLANVHNKFQMTGDHLRVLTVCSAGMLRSPTTAWILSNPPFNFNTRAVGASDEYALVEIDDVLIEWADAIVFMEERHKRETTLRFPEAMITKSRVYVLNLPDDFHYRHPELIELATAKFKEIFAEDIGEKGLEKGWSYK
jgi:predicted protein tyrosine phosphatase